MGGLTGSCAAAPVVATGTCSMSSDTNVTYVTRRFNATPEQVFDAWLDPRLLRAWMFEPPWGGMLRMRVDARVGGSFSFLERRNGRDHGVTGTYVEIDRPHRLVCTWRPMPEAATEERLELAVRPLAIGSEICLSHASVRTVAAGWNRMLQALGRALGGAKWSDPIR